MTLRAFQRTTTKKTGSLLEQSLGIFYDQGIPNEIIGLIFSFLDYKTVQTLRQINEVLGALASNNLTVLDIGNYIAVSSLLPYPRLDTVYGLVSVYTQEELSTILSMNLNWLVMRCEKGIDLTPIFSHIRTYSPHYMEVAYENKEIHYYRLPEGRYYFDCSELLWNDNVRLIPFTEVNYRSIIVPYSRLSMKVALESWEKMTGRDRSTILSLHVGEIDHAVFNFLELLPQVDTIRSIVSFFCGAKKEIRKIKHLLIPVIPETIGDVLMSFPNLETMGINLDNIEKCKYNHDKWKLDIDNLERSFATSYHPETRRHIRYQIIEKKKNEPKPYNSLTISKLRTTYPHIKFISL